MNVVSVSWHRTVLNLVVAFPLSSFCFNTTVQTIRWIMGLKLILFASVNILLKFRYVCGIIVVAVFLTVTGFARFFSSLSPLWFRRLLFVSLSRFQEPL